MKKSRNSSEKFITYVKMILYMQDIEKPVLIKRVYNKNLTEQMQKTLDSTSKKSLKKE